MFQLLSLLLILLGPGHELAANDLICAHHQLCNLAQEILHESERERLRPLFPSSNSDPHEQQVDPALLKEYYKASYLLLPSPELSPWLTNVLERRGPENTYVASVQVQSITGSYPGARAHFWLYEDEICGIATQLRSTLASWKFKVRPNSFCGSARAIILKKRLKEALAGKKVILTHDALAPLLESWGINFFVLFPGGHGHEVAPEVFKGLHQLLQQTPQVLWLVETEIGLAPQVAALVRPQDWRVHIKISGDYPGAVDAPLRELAQRLSRLESP